MAKHSWNSDLSDLSVLMIVFFSMFLEKNQNIYFSVRLKDIELQELRRLASGSSHLRWGHTFNGCLAQYFPAWLTHISVKLLC